MNVFDFRFKIRSAVKKIKRKNNFINQGIILKLKIVN